MINFIVEIDLFIDKMIRTLIFGCCILLSDSVSAQDGAMTGLDVYFGEDGYFDNLEDALVEPEKVIYLDLSMQSPKLKAIPSDVFKLVYLRYLELGFNQIAKVDERIAELKQLEVLGLDGNKYLKTTPIILVEMNRLKEIRLKDTGLSVEQMKELSTMLPPTCKLLR